MKYKYMVVFVIISIALALVSIHYSYHNSIQRVTELPLCDGQYVPAPPSGNLGGDCQGTGPSKIASIQVRQKDDLEYYGFAVAGLLLIAGVLVSFKQNPSSNSR